MEPAVSLDISHSSYSEEDKRVADVIQKLVNNELDATQAARDIDATIVTEIENAEEPDVLGWFHFLWNCLGKSAMQVPATHSGQVRLVELLQQLQRLPRHTTRQLINGSIFQKELWSLTPANNYEGFEQWMWELNEGHFTGVRQVEKSDSAASLYLNFSAFLARLLAFGVVEATRLSALIRPSPFTSRKPSRDSAKVYGVYASAAAQWIIYAGETLFEMCDKDTLIMIGTGNWTRNVWERWKDKFDVVVGTEYLNDTSRALASLAARRMREIESAGITTDAAGKFGFLTATIEDGEVTYTRTPGDYEKPS